MPITIKPTTLRYKNGNTFIEADCIKGDDGDPTTLIDDTAGAGDTDKAWSADKLSGILDIATAQETEAIISEYYRVYIVQFVVTIASGVTNTESLNDADEVAKMYKRGIPIIAVKDIYPDTYSRMLSYDASDGSYVFALNEIYHKHPETGKLVMTQTTPPS